MTSPAQSTPSLLKRVRVLPKEVQRRLKGQITNNSSKTNETVVIKDPKSDLKNPKSPTSCYNCRYLGQTTVYTLQPQACNDFAMLMEETRSEKRAPRANIHIDANAVQITYCPSSPIGTKTKDISPQHLSVFLPQKGSSPKSPKRRPKSDQFCQFHCAKNLNRELVNETNKERSKSAHMYHGFHNQDNLEVQYENNRITNRHSCCDITRDEDSKLPPVIPHPELIMMTEVAYCVTIPDTRLFILTSRGTKGLLCRVFLFSKPEKADEIKSKLAFQFRAAFAS